MTHYDPLDDHYLKDDPGNVLIDRLNKEPDFPDDKYSALNNLLYTAEERDLLHFRVDPDDAILIYRIVKIALEASPQQLKKMRM